MAKQIALIRRQRVILRLIESSGGQMSFAEIGRRLGVSRETVRVLARRAGSDARKQNAHI
jgi:DNA-binding CsgD family transcriptional regulator